MDSLLLTKAGPLSPKAEPSGTTKGRNAARKRLLWIPSLLLFVLSFLYLRGCTTWPSYYQSQSEQKPSGRDGDLYLLGVGKADITGPVVEINMMGYADTRQIGSGLRQRIYSRAFIVGDVDRPEDRFVYLVLDTAMGDTAIRYGILEELSKLGPSYAVYTQQNVAVTGTHSHSGPGAWLNYLLPQITSKGFSKQSYDAIVQGAVLSIRRAHMNLRPGYLTVGHQKIQDANINRSLYAYLANPEVERAQYNVSAEDDGSVEKTMTLVKFKRAVDGKAIGVLTWFPVHGTSMLGNNTLISGDNKGVAAYLFEKSVEEDFDVADGFVAGFSQANVGDTSPNVLGAWCEDGSNQQCSFENSTCANGRSQACHGRGPFFREKDNGAASCLEIGRRQFQPAKVLFDWLEVKGTPIVGSTVKAFHTFHNMTNYTFPLENGTYVRTCAAALGYSFAGGTTDGPGAFDFTQNNPGEPSASPVWSYVSKFLKEPTEHQKRCHFPKPILLDVGEMDKPYQWTPNVVDVQVLRVGQLVIIVNSGEATTMAGRRWKSAIKSSATDLSLSGVKGVEPIVVIGGPANSYTHYITTPEEYAIQRYEGASTLYGPWTLNAYINLTLTYLPYLAFTSTSKPKAGPLPPNNVNNSLSFITPVIYDRPAFFRSFGDVVSNVRPAYKRGSTVSCTFVGANPRNNLRLEQTFASVEQWDVRRFAWKRIRDDADWSLVYKWRKTSEVLGTSEVTIDWETGVDRDVEVGRYRIRYFGDSKSVGSGEIVAFEGKSMEFVLY